MLTSIWRSSFQNYLSSVITISQWTVDHPQADLEFSETNPWRLEANTLGFLPPLRNIDIVITSPKEAKASATQELFILARFDRSLKYHELPINKLEGYWVTLSSLVVANYNKILPSEIQAARGLLGMTVAAQEFPVSVSPSGERGSDWIATLSFGWYLNWLIDIEDGQLNEEYEIKAVGGKVYRSWLDDFQNKRLDFESLYAPREE